MLSDDTFSSMIFNIQLAVKDTDKSIRIYFRGYCDENHMPYYQEIPFPIVKLRTPPQGTSEVLRVRSIFKDDKSVAILEDAKGIIRIRIGDPEDDILRTRIHRLTLSSQEQYNARFAIGSMERAPEVKEAARKMGLEQTVPRLSGLVTPSSERFPHLPPAIENKSMDEMLDLIAVTLHSIVIFGACSDQYMVYDAGRLEGGR